MTLQVVDDIKRGFLLSVLEVNGFNPFKLNINDTEVEFPNYRLEELVRRMVEDKTTLIPFVNNRNHNTVLLLLLNPDIQLLLTHNAEIINFLFPTMVEPFPAQLRYFDVAKGQTGQYGSVLYPEGYLCYRLPYNLLDNALEGFCHWCQLEEQRPEIMIEMPELSTYLLRRDFQESLALKNWEEAEKTLEVMRYGHYISDENCRFLQIQLLANQSRWTEIWNHEDYSLISGLNPLPLAVRRALLSAFYYAEIAPIEEDSNINICPQILLHYRFRLGTLLAFRTGLEGDHILRVFAYHYAITGDIKNLEKILHNDLTEKTRKTVTTLLLTEDSKDDQKTEIKGESNSLEQAKQLLMEQSYDEAFWLLLDLPHSLERTRMLLFLASITEDRDIIQEVRILYSQLEPEERDEIRQDENFSKWQRWLVSEEVLGDDIAPKSWGDWFLLLRNDHPNLLSYIELLPDFTRPVQQSLFDLGTVNEIAEIILDCLTGQQEISTRQRQALRLTLSAFTAFIIDRPDFPYLAEQDLYLYIIVALQTWGNRNENNTLFLLQLLDGVGQLEVEACYNQWDQMETWMQFPPSRRMSGCILEILNLFFDYGVPGFKIISTWNNWMGVIIDQLSADNSTQIQSWLDLGRVINAPPGLLDRLEDFLKEKEYVDPLAELPELTITIFSCREKAAKRATQRLLERNDKLKVNVCTDDRMNEQVESFARNSDLAVVVTTCTSHALTTGIMPLLKNPPVYPRSSGETGIIEAIEVWVK